VSDKQLKLPAPRPTAWAGIVFAFRYGLPIIALGAIIDLLIWIFGAR
jgi:hypothetical protein